MPHQYVVPAAAQLPPLPHTLGVLPGYYANQPTTLVMREKIMSWTGDDYHIKTTDGASVLRVRGTVMSMSGRTEVLDNQGHPLFTVRKEIFSFLKNYYAESPQGSKFLTVDGEFSLGRNKATIGFLNASDGQQVQLKMKGDWLDMTTEIKLGNTVVARIDREMRTGWQILGGPQTYFVTVAPNVDMALMVAMKHPAKEVHVTGTFDDWSKSVLLEKKGGGLHEKLVELPQADEKIYYKFVVDDNWTTDHTAPQETDSANNTNNVLFPHQIKKSSASTDHTSVGKMAASSDLPGSFPETPAAEHTGFRGVDSEDDFEAQGKSEPTFGVSPLPASSGIGNPVQLQPGERVPHPSSFTSNTVHSAVTTDKESYERGADAYQLPNVVTPQQERDAKGGGMFGLPELSSGMIPESSLPMGGTSSYEKDPGITIQSAGPQSTTAQLAGQVPLEPRGVPEIVSESQAEAGFAPEASNNAEAVREKSAMEKELESKVPEEPATSEGTSHANGGTTDKKATTDEEMAGMAAGGAAIAVAAGYAGSRGLPASIQQSIDQMNRGIPIDSNVPETVQESIAAAHVSPEAAASSEMVQEKSAMESELLSKIPTEQAGNDTQVPPVVQESMAKVHSNPEAAAYPEAVQEKSAMEAELLKKVPEKDMGGEPAPSASAALSETAPVPTMKSTETPLASNLKSTEQPLAAGIKSTQTPLAPAMKATEAPLSEVMTANKPPPISKTADVPANGSTTSGPGLAAPAAAPAKPSAMAEALKKPEADSRDVSPMTRGDGTHAQSQPTVTTGVGSSSTAAKSTPANTAAAKAAASSPMSSKTGESSTSTAADAKKEKRKSGFFGKLKSKFSDKDKK
ncbi:hypothetical protein MMC13_000184 [Lambiella insularis]|nr:hypothetical protein [Lambiella insularis]